MPSPLDPSPILDDAQIESYRTRFATQLTPAAPGRSPIVMGAASGCTVKAADGRVYLDMTGGDGVANVGHSHALVVDAIVNQARLYSHGAAEGGMVLPAQVELVERLIHAAGGILPAAHWAVSGAESNELALAVARAYTGRTTVIAFEGSHHGAVGTSRYIPFTDSDAVRAAIDEKVAAVIVEPLQSAASRGPGDDFLPALRQWCDDAGALLIVDEILGGLGRSGTWFSHQHWDIRPDIITMAGGLGGGLPLGVVLSTPEILGALTGPESCQLAAEGGNPVACAAGIAVVDVIESEGLVEKSAVNGAYLRERLHSVMAQFPEALLDVRGVGLWCVCEVAPSAQVIVDALRARGVLASVGDSSQTLRVTPPLVITPAEIDVFIGVLRAVFASRAGIVVDEGHADHDH